MTKRRLPGLSEDERALWQRMVKDVRPLAHRPPPPDPPATRPRSFVPRDMPIATPSLPGLPARTGPPAAIDARRLRRLGRGHETVQSILDLHGCSAPEAHLRLARHMAAAAARGERVVLVITGKGGARHSQTGALPAALRRRADFGEEGVLKRMLPLWLEGPDLAPLVAGHARAHRRHGGEGAFYILLRRQRG